MKLIQQINNVVMERLLNETGETLAANLRTVISDNTNMTEDRAHLVAKVMVMWSIIKADTTSLQTALTYDMVCTLAQRVLTTSSHHTSLANDMAILSNRIYGEPKNIAKVQRYIAKLAKQVDTKVSNKIRTMNIASQLLHRHVDPKIKQQLLDMI